MRKDQTTGGLSRIFFGVTPWIAVFFAPVPAYVLWINFKSYTGSPFVLVIPVALAIAAGYFERVRGLWDTARWLMAATYCVIAIGSIIDSGKDHVDWWMLPLILVGALAWTAVAVGIPALLFVAVGRWLRMRWAA
jgi:hypothetical protein